MEIFVVRLVVGAVAILRGVQKLSPGLGDGFAATVGTVERLGFASPRVTAGVVTAAQVLGGLMLVLGLFVPLGAGFVIGVAIVALRVRPRDGRLLGDIPSILDAVVIAGCLWVAFGGPGEVALDRVLGLEVGGGAAAVGGLLLALLGAAGGMMLVDQKIAARNRAADDDDLVDAGAREPVAETPPAPLTAEEATDPGEHTDGESVPDPIRAFEEG